MSPINLFQVCQWVLGYIYPFCGAHRQMIYAQVTDMLSRNNDDMKSFAGSEA